MSDKFLDNAVKQGLTMQPTRAPQSPGQMPMIQIPVITEMQVPIVAMSLAAIAGVLTPEQAFKALFVEGFKPATDGFKGKKDPVLPDPPSLTEEST